MNNYPYKHKRMTCDERQGESRVRENFMHGLVDEVSPVRRKSLCRRGFTLIELLFVIAIITILTSLLLPAISNVKSKAKQIECISNLKQLNIALFEYINDYNSWYPMGVANEGSLYFTWTQKIAPYCTQYSSYQEAYNKRASNSNSSNLKYWKLFICPEAKTLWGDDNGGVDVYTGKYTCNGDVMPNGVCKRVGFMGNPSWTGILWDGKYGEWEGPAATCLASIQLTGGTPDFRHLKNICVLYADGHVSSSRWSLILPIAYGANGNNNNLWK